MGKYIKRFLEEEQGAETLEYLVVLAVAAGVIAIGVKTMKKSNSKLANMIDGI